MDSRVTVAQKLGKDKILPKRRIPIFTAVATLLLVVVAIIIWQPYKNRPSVDSASDMINEHSLSSKMSDPELSPKNLRSDLVKNLTDRGSAEKETNGTANTHNGLDIDKNGASSNKGKSEKVQFMSEQAPKRKTVDITRLEKELSEIEAKIAAINKESASTNISENDDLSAMLLMVKEREEKQQQLKNLREKWQKNEQKRLEEIFRLKNERKKAKQQVIENDISAYEKIVSSPYGKDLKETAWKKLVDGYPEASDLEIGNVDVLRMVLYKEWIEPNSGIEFVWVTGGCFQMGDTFGDGDNDEKPVHEVCVDTFVLSRYEVTQGQWQKLMGHNPSKFTKGDNYPVEQVSWDDIQNFIRILNSQSNKFFRLPTEAEWEYAARSGGMEEKYSGGNDIDQLAWYKGNSGGSTRPVGTKEPNGLGLYDMSGNVWEWCSDRYGESYYQKSPRNNPKGASVGSFRVIRDGGWNGSPWLCRSANRDKFMPGNRLDNLGFRLVLTVK
jgi:formylglycine-generating enzyme required for sulfatase activity